MKIKKFREMERWNCQGQTLTRSNINFSNLALLISVLTIIVLPLVRCAGIKVVVIDSLLINLKLNALNGLLHIKFILIHGINAIGQFCILVTVVQTLFLGISIVTVAVLLDVFACVFLLRHLRLEDGIGEGVKIHDVIGTVLASTARVRGAELEVHLLVLVHALVIVALFVVVVVVSVLVVAIVIVVSVVVGVVVVAVLVVVAIVVLVVGVVAVFIVFELSTVIVLA